MNERIFDLEDSLVDFALRIIDVVEARQTLVQEII